SQFYIDLLRYINKELSTADITEGKNVHNWAQAAEAAGNGGVLPRMTREFFKKTLADFTKGEVEVVSRLPGEASKIPPQILSQVMKLKAELKGVKATINSTSTMSPIYAARRRAAMGTEFEAKLMTPMIQQFMGVVGISLSDSVMDLASPLRGGNPTVQRELYNMKQVALAKRGACILHPNEAAAPLSISGFGDVLQEKFGAFNPSDSVEVQQVRAERMRRFLASRMHYSVIVHEMGHSVGMRHNFVSSSDAWQYRPQYWQLRTKNGQVMTECTELSANGEDCVGPRYFDPVTAEERDNMIWMWMHSSVMDYPGEITQDLLGLGIFDFAAARMYYGDVTSVNRDPSYNVGSAKSKLYMDKMDNFGGITGIQHALNDQEFNYSQLQNRLRLITDCQVVPDPTIYKPARWNSERDGVWSPLLDGLMVKVDGQYTRCKQQKVDYVYWQSLRMPTTSEQGGWYGGGPSVDTRGRTRMPYGFGTDGWADLGNLSVYRHDNGADAYEIFNYMVTQQEVGHVFDAYRRGRSNFSVRKAANRTLGRYNTKLRDGAKGLGLMRNVYKDFALEVGYDFETLWPIIAGEFYADNIIASSQVFDHFSRLLARPEVGDHFYQDWDPVLRSVNDAMAEPGPTQVIIPNGATGYYEDIGIGGKLVENQLSDDHGEYDSDFTINCGSYYDKLSTAMLFTESVDNFISDSRMDFVDPRYRSVSLADLFPDGYRRWLANNLTGDEEIKGPRLVSNNSGRPVTDLARYPATPIGWTSWWGDEPEVCFPGNGTTVCSGYAGAHDGAFNPQAPEYTAVIDPQVGWEQQKFLIAWTMLYLPENENLYWLDMLRLWELGVDDDPEFANRIEFHNPTGKIYVAKTYGKEVIFGKTVQKGIAARVLEYSNQLLNEAYETTDGPDLDGDGSPDWYEPVYSTTTGLPIVKYDSTIMYIDPEGYVHADGGPGCNASENFNCTCYSNRSCVKLSRYVSIPSYLREALTAYQLGSPEQRGVWD
ncbi:MAG: hypothetical protein JRJ87_26090, partial [Deltaproteobacteria bacterium]|nr:hypothetical protein [Deltaproteobacteria bacterium]